MNPYYKIWSTLTLLLAFVLLPAAAAGQTILNLTEEGLFADHNNARFIQEDASEGAGTGILDPFARTKSNQDVVAMMNTGNDVVQFQTEAGPWTTSLLLSTITDREIPGYGIFKEFILDINQTLGSRIYPLNDVHVWEDDQPDLNCYNPDVTAPGHSPVGGGQWGTCHTGAAPLPVFWLDRDFGGSFPGTTGNATVILDYSLESGSGNQTDMTMLLPLAAFQTGEDCAYGSPTCDTYVYVYAIFGKADECGGFTKTVGNKTYTCEGNDDGFEEWSTLVEPFVTISKDLAGSIDETHEWDLTKDVDKTTCDLFIGGSCTFNYTVEVTEIETVSATIGGTVTYYVPSETPGGEAALDAVVTVESDSYTGDGTVVWDDPTCAVGQTFTLGAGDTKLCTFTVSDGEGDAGYQENTVTATVEFNDGLFSAMGSATIATNLTGPPSVDVTDTVEGPLGSGVTSSVTYDYGQLRECSTNYEDYTEGFYSYQVSNTAEIVQTGDEDSETVTVNCYAPVVSKTGAGSYDDNFEWTIDKSVAPDEHFLFIGDDADSDYDVAVDLTYYKDDFKVWGTITVNNPHPTESMDVEVADALDGLVVVIDCGDGADDTSLIVGANSSDSCDYEATPASDAVLENEATVTFNGLDFPAGATVNFTLEDTNGPAEITVDDSVQGELGSATDDFTFEYSDNFACPTDKGLYVDGHYMYTVDNTATILETDQSDSETVTVHCYAPLVSKNGSGQFTRQHRWTISKLATPDVLHLFIGDDDDVDFDVDVQKTTTDLGFSVTGTITVVNPAPMPMTVALVDVLDDGTPVDLDCAGSLDVPAEDSATCDYSAVPDDDAATLNTVTATLNSVDFVATASISFGIVVDGYDEVDVTDTVEGPLGTISASQLFEYVQNFACPTELDLYVDGVYSYTTPNTAEIVQTGQTADEEVTVYCYAPSIAKNASSSLTRTYEWMIEKAVDPDAHAMFAGDDADSDYTVTVTKTGHTDSDWYVFGTITVSNPHPSEDLDVLLSDVLDDATVASLDCANPLTVPAGGSADCDYEADPEDGSATENTVSFGLNGLTFDWTAPFSYEEGTINEVYATVNVTDDFDNQGPVALGSVYYGDSPGIFEYDRNFACSRNPADYTNGHYSYSKPNTAEITETGQTADAEVDVDCYAPVVTKTAEPALTRTYYWDIDKSVSPASWHLFDGESGTSEYTVDVTLVEVVDSGFGVVGVITVVNYAPMEMTVDVSDVITGATGDVNIVCNDGDGGSDLTIDIEGIGTCDYNVLTDGTNGTNTATATLNGIGFDGSASVDYAEAEVTEINPTVDVDDTNGDSWNGVDDDATFTYSRTFECRGDEGTHDNTATIVQTGQSDDASVTVECHDITVTKDARTSYTREYDWVIDKWAIPGGGGDPVTELNLRVDQIYTLKYIVEVDLAEPAYEDSDWHVTGTITVSNAGNPIPATINDVTDIAPGLVVASVECGVAFPYAIPEDGTLECTYHADLGDATGGTNTATALLQLHDYASDGTASGAGEREVDGSEDVVFGDPTLLVDECTDVSDPLGGGLLGEACADEDLPKQFEYFHELRITADQCGGFEIPNTATEVERDTGETGSASWNVLVNVECPDGCTLTQGYWKTHNESFKGGASKKADPTWGVIEPSMENSEFFLSGDTWFGVFWTAPKGNAYYNLAHQWMAAYLNCSNVDPERTPDCSVIEEAFDGALAFFIANAPDAVGKGKNKNSDLAQQLIEWAGILGSFNEGLIGPGHCDDDGIYNGNVQGLVNVAGSVEAAVSAEGVSEAPSETHGDAVAKVAVGDEEMSIDGVSQVDAPAPQAPAPIELPTEFKAVNYPNPFNPTTTIQVALPEASRVRIAVYDVLGRMVTMLVDGNLSAGTHSVTFDAGSLPSGVYLYRFEWAGGAVTRTMQLLK